jgi:UDP-N-acetylglucosamine pyrophosphorylase
MTKKMREMGVEWVFIGGVDNCLVKMVDPVLMGIAIDKKVTVACKSIVKIILKSIYINISCYINLPYMNI